VDQPGHRGVGHGRLGGSHAADQVRRRGPAGLRVVADGLAAGLAEVNLVPEPALAVLLAVAGVQVAGGDDLESAWPEAMLAGLPPDHLLPVLTGAVVLLYPDRPQRLDGGSSRSQAGAPAARTASSRW